MSTLHRAKRILTAVPGQPAIDNGAFIEKDGFIQGIGPFRELAGLAKTTVDHGETTLVPGLINAHCHLELSHLAGKTLNGTGFVPWVEHLLSLPLMDPDPEAVARACRLMIDSGTAMAGDIATRFPQDMAAAMDRAGLFFVSFAEAIGERVPESTIPKGNYEHGVHSAAGHSLYTTHTDLLRAAKAETRSRNLPFSLHLSEHEDEVAIMLGTPSRFLDMLQSRGRLLDFKAPGRRPVQQAHALGLLDKSTLAIHCVQLDESDVTVLRESGATVCLCPRSNAFIGVGRAPWETLAGQDIPLCLGTDSIASNHDLDLWNEVLYLKRHWRGRLNFDEALSMLTRTPATALGAPHLGTLEPGKAARFAIVPPDVQNAFSND